MAAERTLLVPTDEAQTRFVGFLRLGNDEYKVCVSNVRYMAAEASKNTPWKMVLGHASIEAEPPLAALLAPHEALLKVRLKQASSLEGFVRELEELVTVSIPHATTALESALPDVNYYNQLMMELEAVGWNRLTHLSDDLRTLELQLHDGGGRLHAVLITLAPDYPKTVPVCAVDAPDEFVLHWTTVSGPTAPVRPTLKTILDQFELFLQEYQAFWNVLDEIDATCCVLEPQHPSRATGRRRLALHRHVSVQVEVDPKRPRGLCDLKFFGSDATVTPLRERWSDRLFEWEEHRSLPQNLEILLDVELPSPSIAKTEEFALECGICYCYRLDVVEDPLNNDPINNKSTNASTVKTVIPDRLCENPKCNRPFHEKCLFEWLKALPTTRQSFSTVFGECPYCREAISAKFVA